METVNSHALIETLRHTRLLQKDQLEVISQKMRSQLVGVRSLARIILRQGWLTVYQMNQILNGNGNDLVVGPYQILNYLGKGGQSTVFQAINRDWDTLIALKVIRPEILNSQDAIGQFIQEMEAMATLDHENIVRLLDADRIGDTCYCAMEYIEGTDLGKYVRLNGSLQPATACEIIRQVALGLQHAHERNLIHRDIKPVNLLLAGDSNSKEYQPVVKILDWGLASLRPPRSKENSGDGGSTRAILGTADYVSPEQAINPDGVEIRGDIYSLGCTFYFLLAGHPPFPNGTVMQKIMYHQKKEPTSLDQIRPDLPLGLTNIIERMMAKRPEDRYQTPAAVALSLAPYCHSDRLILPRLDRETRYRLGLESPPVNLDTPLPGTIRLEISPDCKDGNSSLNDFHGETLQK